MEDFIEKKLSREELAIHLEELARRIREGRFSSKNKKWSVPDQIDTRIRFKEKKGRFEAKLKFRWSTLKDYDLDARKAVDDWQDSIKNIKKKACRVLIRIFLERSKIINSLKRKTSKKLSELRRPFLR